MVINWKGYGAQFEWSSWATLNELTTPNCPITAYSYNTRSGTRPVSDIRIGQMIMLLSGL